MHRLMLLAGAGDDELAGRLASDLADLDYEVSRPEGGESPDLNGVEQVDLFVITGHRLEALEKLTRTLDSDQVLSDIPVLLAAEEHVLERLDFCRLADDILLLPCRRSELAARLRMLMWRFHKVDSTQEVRAGSLVLNLSTYEVTESGAPVDLTFKEYELLRYLATHRGRVCTRRHLLVRVWGEDYYGGPRTVDVHIRRIRSKIEAAGKEYIQTVRSVGYRFIS